MSDIIDLPMPVPSGDVTWTQPEREYESAIFSNRVVTNVSRPALIPFVPERPNGTAAVICPGGGFFALSIDSEGTDVARWLCERGITAFVLKYRLAPSQTEDAVAEMVSKLGNREALEALTGPVIPLGLSDGLTAMRWVREHAGDWQLDDARIGIVGFSAGGAVAANVAMNYEAGSRPAFAAPIYASIRSLERRVQPDAPPLFALAASNDPLGLAPDSVALYNDWIEAGKNAELHLYADGGHGFGMKRQGLPSDTWIDRLMDWLIAQGMAAP